MKVKKKFSFKKVGGGAKIAVCCTFDRLPLLAQIPRSDKIYKIYRLRRRRENRDRSRSLGIPTPSLRATPPGRRGRLPRAG